MSPKANISGIIVVNKPEGITSFQVISRLRRILGEKKIGHCGTLDPFATGVLPVCIGKATRVVRYMDGYDKSYRCTVSFGAFTDTQDREGTVIGGRMPELHELASMKADDFSGLRSIFASFIGEQYQKPPMYSAIKIDGKPLYEYARKGISMDVTPRRIVIYSCEIHSISVDDGLTADFTVSCSKGTYIRTICNDLGMKSGYGAHAKGLVRTSCGPFRMENAYSLEEIEEAVTRGELDSILLPETQAITQLPIVELTKDEAIDIRLGRQLLLSQFEGRIDKPDEDAPKVRYALFCEKNWIAVVFPDVKEGEDILRIERVIV